MLKLTVMIECDLCHDTFDRIAVSTDRDPPAWEMLPPLVEAKAEASGWSIYNAHHCADCASETIGDTELYYDIADDTIPF